MAKRAPLGEQPYRPLLDLDVVSSVLTATHAPTPPTAKMTTPARMEIVAKAQEIHKPFTVGSSEENDRSLNASTTAALVEKFDQERRMLLTRSEGHALDRLVASLARRLNTQVKLSHVLRAMVSLALHAEGEIDRRAGELIGLVRPANGDAKALQRFEREIAKILGAAIRDAGPLR